MNTFTMKSGREKLTRTRHPWIYSGALVLPYPAVKAGSVVRVNDSEGKFLVWGHYNPGSKLLIRALSWEEKNYPDETWFRRKIRQSALARNTVENTNAYRLIFGESDGLPGLILDQFGPVGVLQILTKGMDQLRGSLMVWILEEIPQLEFLWEKSEGDGRGMEGLEEKTGFLTSRSGTPPPPSLEIYERGYRFQVDLGSQKTGFYTDQRDNRHLVSPYAKNRRFLDAFSYTGAFSVHALGAGATEAVLLDSSRDALDQAQAHLQLNGFGPGTMICGDGFEELRNLKRSGERFDLISLDPPKLVKTREHKERGLRAYKDLNLQALQILSPGGILATFSCSGLVSFEEFRTMVAYSAKDAGVPVQILAPLWQSPCHPVLTTYPESAYLKGLLLRRGE